MEGGPKTKSRLECRHRELGQKLKKAELFEGVKDFV